MYSSTHWPHSNIFAPEKLHQELRKTELGQAVSEHLTLPDTVEMEYQEYKYTPTYSKQNKKVGANNAKQFWSMPVSVSAEDKTAEADVSQEHKTVTNAWPGPHQNGDNLSEISANLIKKQGDYPPFETKNNSFINAMELFYCHTRKKNSKDLF